MVTGGPGAPQQTGYGGWEHPGYAPRTPPKPPEPAPTGGIWRILAVITLALAALGCLFYAGWAGTERRAIFGDFADDASSVSMRRAEYSDAQDEMFLYIAVALIAVAVLFWLLTRVVGRLPFMALGFTGLALLAVGGIVVGVGAFLTSMVGSDPSEADKAVIGYLIMGGGFVLVAAGLIAGLFSLLLAGRTDDELDFGVWNG